MEESCSCDLNSIDNTESDGSPSIVKSHSGVQETGHSSEIRSLDSRLSDKPETPTAAAAASTTAATSVAEGEPQMDTPTIHEESNNSEPLSAPTTRETSEVASVASSGDLCGEVQKIESPSPDLDKNEDTTTCAEEPPGSTKEEIDKEKPEVVTAEKSEGSGDNDGPLVGEANDAVASETAKESDSSNIDSANDGETLDKTSSDSNKVDETTDKSETTQEPVCSEVETLTRDDESLPETKGEHVGIEVVEQEEQVEKKQELQQDSVEGASAPSATDEQPAAGGGDKQDSSRNDEEGVKSFNCSTSVVNVDEILKGEERLVEGEITDEGKESPAVMSAAEDTREKEPDLAVVECAASEQLTKEEVCCFTLKVLH